jgi:hypothetical protein
VDTQEGEPLAQLAPEEIAGAISVARSGDVPDRACDIPREFDDQKYRYPLH